MPISRLALRGGSATMSASLALSTVSDPAGVAPGRPGLGARSGGRRSLPPLQAADGDLIAVPEGFSYELVSVAGRTELDHGQGVSPGRPDGTGAFRTRNRWRLVQNHRLEPGEGPTVPLVEGTAYDVGLREGAGGCTVIETTRGGLRSGEWVGLSGTLRNSGGGPAPWGTWLTCERTEYRAGSTVNGTVVERDHGYVFEVVPKGPDHQVPEPIRAWGRFAHQGVAVSHTRREVLLTEDASRPNGLLYRWTADGHARLGEHVAERLEPHEGTLSAMRVVLADGSTLPDLAYATSADIGRPFRVRWVPVPDRDATTTPVRIQFGPDEVTRSRKLTGAWSTREGVFVTASFATELGTDLPLDAVCHDGQLWFYDYHQQTLTLHAYFPYVAAQHDGSGPASIAYPDLLFDGPAHVQVSPYGTVVLSEDGENYQHLISWTADQGAQAITRNLVPHDDGYAEMAGPTFSPDGTVLFGSIHQPGHTFAIHGPWMRYLG